MPANRLRSDSHTVPTDGRRSELEAGPHRGRPTMARTTASPQRGRALTVACESRNRIGFPRRFVTTTVAGLAISALAFTVACSHTSPYRRPGITTPSAQLEGQLLFRVLLIGDAGEPAPQEPVLRSLRRWVQKAPERTLVVFLGDNAYPEGMTPARQQDAERRILIQLAVVSDSVAQALFIPGNHDWGQGKVDGPAAVLRQEDFVRQHAFFLPRGGCPGPEYLDLPDGRPVVRVIALDTQWWLQGENKPTDTCPEGSPDAVIRKLTQTLATDLAVIVTAHHPLATHGRHGGFFEWQAHLFPLTHVAKWLWIPLPGVGSLYPLFRWHVRRSDQDLIGGLNRRMRASLETALSSRSGTGGPLIYAAGHDHNLQILEGDVADYLVVSGLGSSSMANSVGHGSATLFAHEHPGFMAVDFTDEGIWLSVVEPIGGVDEVVFRIPVNPRE